VPIIIIKVKDFPKRAKGAAHSVPCKVKTSDSGEQLGKTSIAAYNLQRVIYHTQLALLLNYVIPAKQHVLLELGTRKADWKCSYPAPEQHLMGLDPTRGEQRRS